MRAKMKAGYRMTGLLMAGCRIKIFPWERHLFILTNKMWDSFKIDSRMWDEKRKITCYRRYTKNCHLNQAGLG